MAENGTKIDVPTVAGDSAICKITLNPGNYILSWENAENAKVTVMLNGTEVTRAEGKEEYEIECTDSLTETYELGIIVTSDDGFNGYSIDGLSLIINFDFEEEFNNLRKNLFKFSVDSLLEGAGSTELRAKGEEYKETYESILSDIRVLYDKKNHTIGTYEDYKLYANPNAIQKRIEELEPLVKSYNDEVKEANKVVIKEANEKYLEEQKLDDEIKNLQATLTATGEKGGIPTDAPEKIASAQEQLTEASAKLQELNENNDGSVKYDEDNEDIKAIREAIKNAQDTINSINVAISENMLAYNTIWGELSENEDGTIASGYMKALENANSEANEQAESLTNEVIKKQATDEIEEIVSTAKDDVKIEEDMSNLSSAAEYKDGDIATINAAIEVLNTVVDKYKKAQDNMDAAVKELKDSLAEITKLIPEGYDSIRTKLVVELQNEVKIINGHIDNYGLEYGTLDDPAARKQEILDEITTYGTNVDAALKVKEAYKEGLDKFAELQDYLDDINQYKIGFGEYYEFNPEVTFKGAYDAIETSIADKKEEYTGYYEGDGDFPGDFNIDAVVSALNNAVNDFKQNCDKVYTHINELRASYDNADALYKKVESTLYGESASISLLNADATITDALNDALSNIKGKIQETPDSLKAVDEKGYTNQQLFDAVLAIKANPEAFNELKKLLGDYAGEITDANNAYLTGLMDKINEDEIENAVLKGYVQNVATTLAAIANPFAKMDTEGITETEGDTETITAAVNTAVDAALADFLDAQKTFGIVDKQIDSANTAISDINSFITDCNTSTEGLKELVNTLTKAKEYVDSINANATVTAKYMSMISALEDSVVAKQKLVTEALTNGYNVNTQEVDDETLGKYDVVEVEKTFEQPDLEALTDDVNGVRNKIIYNEDCYKQLTSLLNSAYNTGAKYLEDLKKQDSEGVTGIAEEIKGLIKELDEVDYNVFISYTELFEEGQFEEYKNEIKRIEESINEAYNKICSESADANNAVKNEWEGNELEKMYNAFDGAVLAYKEFANFNNAGFKAYLKENHFNLDTYHKNIYEEYDKITALKDEFTDYIVECNSESKIADSRIVQEMLDEANAIVETLDGYKNSAENTVNTLADAYYGIQLSDAKAKVKAAEQQLSVDGIEADGDVADFVSRTLKYARHEVLSEPNGKIAAAEDRYNTNTTIDGEVNIKNLYKYIDPILNPLDSVNGSVIDVEGSLASTWENVFKKTNDYVTDSLKAEFCNYNPSDELKEEWKGYIKDFNDVNVEANGYINAEEPDLAPNFKDLVVKLSGAYNNLCACVTNAKKAIEEIIGNQNAYDKWKDNDEDGLNKLGLESKLDSLKMFVGSLAVGSTEYPTVIDLKVQIDNLDKYVEDQYLKGVLDSTTLANKITVIESDITNAWDEAYNGEVAYLQNQASEMLYEAWNNAQAKHPEEEDMETWREKVDNLTNEVNALAKKPEEEADKSAQYFVDLETLMADMIQDMAIIDGSNPVANAKAEIDEYYQTAQEAVNGLTDGIEPEAVDDGLQSKITSLETELEGAHKAYTEVVKNRVIFGVDNFKWIFGDIANKATDLRADITEAYEKYLMDKANDSIYNGFVAQLEELQIGLDKANELIDNYNAVGGLVTKGMFANQMAQITSAINILTEANEDYYKESYVNNPDNESNLQGRINYWKGRISNLKVEIAKTEAEKQLEEANNLYNEVNASITSGEYANKKELLDRLAEVETDLQNIPDAVTLGEGVENNAENLIEAWNDQVRTPALDAISELNSIVGDAESSKYVWGDVNGDNKVSGADYMKLLGIALMDVEDQEQLTELQRVVADVNRDGYIDITDVAMLVSIIRGELTTPPSNAPRMAPRNVSNTAQLVDMGGNMFAVVLDNQTAFGGIQFDLALTDGLQIVSEKNVERAENYSLSTSDFSDGRHRVILSSLDDLKIESGHSTVYVFEVAGQGEITIVNGVGGDKYGRRYIIGGGDGTTTGIESIDMGTEIEGEIYNVKGQRLPRLQKGVNLVRKADGTTVKVLVK